MRPLTEQEMKTMFEKMAKYIGPNIKSLLENTDVQYCFRLLKDRAFYVSESVMKSASAFGRKEVVSIGTCIGKFSATGKFRIHITALPLLAQYAQHKVWVKPASEMSFLYGNHVLKAGIGRISDGAQANFGCVVFSMADTPLGFGVFARNAVEVKGLGPTDIVVLHQGDVGEFLRDEDTGFATGGKGGGSTGDGTGEDHQLIRHKK